MHKQILHFAEIASSHANCDMVLGKKRLAEQCGVTFPDIMLLPVIARMFGVLVDDLFKESPEGYVNLAERLFAVYEHAHRHEDFMTAAAEYEKLVKAGEATAYDYKSYG